MVRKALDAKSKFESESVEVYGEDHFDFEKIMSSVDREKPSPNMKLLLEQQEMALSRKAGGYRWHPSEPRTVLKWPLDLSFTAYYKGWTIIFLRGRGEGLGNYQKKYSCTAKV